MPGGDNCFFIILWMTSWSWSKSSGKQTDSWSSPRCTHFSLSPNLEKEQQLPSSEKSPGRMWIFRSRQNSVASLLKIFEEFQMRVGEHWPQGGDTVGSVWLNCHVPMEQVSSLWAEILQEDVRPSSFHFCILYTGILSALTSAHQKRALDLMSLWL